MKCDKCRNFFDKKDIIGLNEKSYCLMCFEKQMGNIGKMVTKIKGLFKERVDETSKSETP